MFAKLSGGENCDLNWALEEGFQYPFVVSRKIEVGLKFHV